MSMGVYGIFLPGNHVYVGSTIASLETRHRVHLHALKAGNHDNNKLQELYNKYHTVEFRTLEETTEKDKVRELEQYWMDEMLRQGYTLCNETPALIEGNPLGDIVKQKIRDGLKANKIAKGEGSSAKKDKPITRLDRDAPISEYQRKHLEELKKYL